MCVFFGDVIDENCINDFVIEKGMLVVPRPIAMRFPNLGGHVATAHRSDVFLSNLAVTNGFFQSAA